MYCIVTLVQIYIYKFQHYRDGSACISYALEKDKKTGAVTETWIPYQQMAYEKNDLLLRKEQLLTRAHDCQKVLDFLCKLNVGEGITDILEATIHLEDFKV